jgi:peroxiredoxin
MNSLNRSWLLILLVAALLFCLSLQGCTNATSSAAMKTYTPEEVVEKAKEFSPECRLQEVDPTCNCRKDTYSYADPVFTANMTGDGVWEVSKACPINPSWNGSWYFYEDTNELVVRPANHSDNVTTPMPVISDNVTISENVTENGVKAPDFMLSNIDGLPVKLSDHKGKTVLLDFWISTCPSCKKELPILQEFYDKTSREKVEVLGINVKEYEAWAKRFSESQKLTMPILLDTDGAVATQYGVKGLPTLVIITPDGRIYKTDATFKTLEELEALLP